MENLNEIKETLKEMFRAAIKNAKDGDDENGRWVTIKGTHVFIPDGKEIEDVMREKGWLSEGKEKSEPEWLQREKQKLDRQTTQMYEDRYQLDHPEEYKKNVEMANLDKKIKEEGKKEENDDFVYVKHPSKDGYIKTTREHAEKKGLEIVKKPTEWKDRKDRKNIEKKFTEYAKKRAGIETLESRHNDSDDFYEVSVGAVEDMLTEAYKMGSGSNKKPSKQFLEEVAKKELYIPTLKYRNSDSLDFHEISVWGLKGAMAKAFEEGEKTKKIKNDLSEIIENCKPETDQDIRILKGLTDILEKEEE